MGLVRAAGEVFGLAETGIKALGTIDARTFCPFVGIRGLEAFGDRLPGRYTAVLELRLGVVKGTLESFVLFGAATEGCTGAHTKCLEADRRVCNNLLSR